MAVNDKLWRTDQDKNFFTVNFLKCMQVILLLQRTVQGKNLFTQIICMYVSDIFITETYKGRARTSSLYLFEWM